MDVPDIPVNAPVNAVAYGFADRRDDSGRWPVTDGSGAVVARITYSFWTSRFTITDAAERVVGQGVKQAFGSWVTTDPSGRELMRVAGFSWTNQVPVQCRWGELTLRGRVFGRDWTVVDAGGALVLSSVPDTGAFSFHPDSWQVTSDGRLDLAETVALVHMHRLAVKRGRSANSAASAAT